MKTSSKVIQLLEIYSDDVRHPLIVENPDWEDKINPALTEIGIAYDSGEMERNELILSIRFMLETVYAMGYQKRGEDGS